MSETTIVRRARQFHCGEYRLDLSQPHVMGVLNVTPDSFSDGGRYDSLDRAVDRALQMVEEGASIIDIGGESTRPGAAAADLGEEMRRVIPVLEALKPRIRVPISVDTQKPALMRAAILAGADMINDVRGFRDPDAVEAVAEARVGLCAMHMQGEPRTMQNAPRYQDVVDEVIGFLAARRDALCAAGVAAERVVIDPGFGFGKSLDHNLLLLRELERLAVLECPVLVGISRKSMIGSILDAPVDQRLYGSLAAALIAVERGAGIVRVHDVAATQQALKIWSAVVNSGHIDKK